MKVTTVRVVVGLLAPWVIGGCAPSDDRPAATPSTAPVAAAAPEPDVHHIAREYKRLTLITKEPVDVDPAIAALCESAAPPGVDRAVEAYGPHAHTRVRIFMNAPAADAFARSAAAYPVGSVVVKEKEAVGAGSASNRQAGHNGVGGMVKRSPGYDPANGDWEYFYFEDPAKVETGRIASCVQCHAGGATRDHVFGSWAKGRE